MAKKTKTEKGNFKEGKVSSLILSQAVPLTLAQLIQVVYNIVDRIYLGHMPGAEGGAALTGVGLSFPVISLIAAFTNLFATGGAPLCAIARGKRDEKRALDIEVTTLVSQLINGISCGVIFYLFKRPLLYLLGASDVTYAYASDYLSVYLLGTVFITMGTGMNGFINLQGYADRAMVYMITGAAINLILDPLFIFRFHMEVAGAAAASVISQGIAFVLVLRFLFGKNAVIKIRFRDLKHPKWRLLPEIMTLGLAGFIMSATNCAVQAVCNATLSLHGGDLYVGIMTIINSVREMISLPINGLTAGSQPVISFNFGAGDNMRVKQGIRFMAAVSIGYTALMWLLIILFPTFFLTMFTSEETIISTGKLPLMIYFSGFIFMALQFVGQSSFVALGKAKQSIFFSIFRKVIIVVPLTLLLPHIGGLSVLGVFLAEPISNFLGGLASFLTMYIGTYRKLTVCALPTGSGQGS
ncbi:MAG: MATE family efflux transporter [Lachnospiraceae bacterium]|nr:MATE family efflux transporter [Lachnospiraceae bacterium]